MKKLVYKLIDADGQESTHEGWVPDSITGTDDALVTAYTAALLGISDSRVVSVTLIGTNATPVPPDGESSFVDSPYEAGDKILIEAKTAAGSPHRVEIGSPLASVMDTTDEVAAATIAGAIHDLLAVWKTAAGETLYFHSAHRIMRRRLT